MFFHALTFAGFWGSCLNIRPLGRVVKHPPRDPASVNAMKQTCVIIILAYFTWFQHKQCWNRRLNIKYPFSYTWLLKTNWRQRQLSNVITSPQRHIYACNVFMNETIGEMISHGATHSGVMPCMQIRSKFRLFQVKAMFKQNVNLMVWTLILRLQKASRNKFSCKNQNVKPF